MTKIASTKPAEVQTKEPEVPTVRKRTRPIAKDVKQPNKLDETLISGSPYTLESQNLFIELERLRDNANAEILSIMADQNSIQERAQRDMESIANRAKAEIEARQSRITDLKQSINMIDNGLSAPKPEENAQVSKQQIPPDPSVEDIEQ